MKKDLKDKSVDQASTSIFSIDIFAGCYDQTGIYEMRTLTNQTGGVLVVTDSFQTSIFKNTFYSCFARDDEGYPLNYFDGTMEVFTSNRLKVAGVVGHVASLKKDGENVADVEVGYVPNYL
ncbi:unnamed protein product [[Candida] boidinii]|nr:unnamed protein product [[Candida] boidinii]